MERLNTSLILEQLKNIDVPRPSRDASAKEKEISNSIFQLIKRLEDASFMELIEDEELCPIESEENVNVDVTFPSETCDNEVFEYEYIKSVIDYKDAHPNHKWDTLKTKFRRLKYPYYIGIFRKYLENLGTTREKFVKISEFVWNRYRQARDSHAAIHDADLKRWALEKSRELRLETFKASDYWLLAFKRKNRICGRRVTKFVTYKHEVNEGRIQSLAADFLLKLDEEIYPNFERSMIFNTDQTGFCYETHRDRTLSDRGERTTVVAIANQRAVSHSYTVQPMINMAGELMKQFMIVFQEPTGQFGPRVSEGLLKPRDVFVTCTKSGKVDIATLRNWSLKCLSPNVESKACLIVDSFSSHQIADIFDLPDKDIEVRVLPAGSTSFLQPLDVLIFKQWKAFVKNFTERVMLDQMPLDLHNRNAIIALHTIIHNQMRAPLFKSLILNAWARSGFDVEKSDYKTFTDSLFAEAGSVCSSTGCERSSFLICAYCQKHLCIEHIHRTPIHVH